jgi:hypothetical protein
MARTGAVLGLLLLAGWSILPAGGERSAPASDLRFEVTVAPGLVDGPRDGRLLIVLGQRKSPEPRSSIGETGMHVPPLLGRDVKALGPGVTATVDQTAPIFPIANLGALPPGDYFVQAVLDGNPNFKRPDAPGNLYSEPVAAKLGPARGGTVKLVLTRRVPPDQPPAETEQVKYVKIRSELLSRFHGRPYYLRAGVILPRDFARDKDRRYPLWVRIGGYGTRYTAVRDLMAEGASFRDAWLADGAPRMVLLHLDGAGPYGDPYQVNSANNGPYGDAVTQELVPYVEKHFRCVGRPYARVLDGHSTGGWVSLALQVFYPDFFNGTWSHAPDPVDFRAYELIDVYRDANAYVNRFGFERPSERGVDGDVRTTVRHECQLERVLGRGGRWELSGKDWGAWNATFGPRGADGLPRPLWDGVSGQIDRDVIEHWKKYDLRLVLQKDWPTLGPKLRGKLRIWVGEADDYFLNNAVHLLDDFLAKAKPAHEGKITYGPRQGHGWRGLSNKRMLEEMAAAVERGRKEAGGRRGR